MFSSVIVGPMYLIIGWFEKSNVSNYWLQIKPFVHFLLIWLVGGLLPFGALFHFTNEIHLGVFIAVPIYAAIFLTSISFRKVKYGTFKEMPNK